MSKLKIERELYADGGGKYDAICEDSEEIAIILDDKYLALFAAAPELLEALEAAFVYLTYPHKMWENAW